MPEIIEVDLVRQQLHNVARDRLLTAAFCPKPLSRPGSIVEPRLVAKAGLLWEVTRHAKEMYFIFSNLVVKSHLGMSGIWLQVATSQMDEEIARRGAESRFLSPTHLRYRLDFSGDLSLLYFDARGFGQLSIASREELDAAFAQPDILDPAFSLTRGAAAKIWSSPRPLYHFLHNQDILPGMGAYLGAEWLFRCRTHPLTPGRQVKVDKEVMLTHLKMLLLDARQAQGASFSNYRQVNGEAGSAHQLFQVYGREGLPCFVCQTTVDRLENKRGSQFCPSCQKLG